MFVVMSHVIETLTGMWLGDFLRLKIWSPLGMNNTYFSLKDAQQGVARDQERDPDTKTHLAHGYFWENATKTYIPEPYEEYPSDSGDGAIISSVLDYALWLRSMIFQSSPISPAGHAALRTPRSFPPSPSGPFPNTGPVKAYALGWDVDTYGGETIIHHSGAVLAFGTVMLYMPERQWGVVMMANTLLTSNDVQTVLIHALMDEVLEIEERKRGNWLERVEKGYEEKREKLKNAKELLYPEAPKQPIAMTLPMVDYTGTYFNAGYGRIGVEVVDSSTVRHPYPFSQDSPPEEILQARFIEKDFLVRLDLEHVSGEFFVGYGVYVRKGEFEEVELATFVEFKIGADGKVKQLGVAIEEEMKGEKMWFGRED